MTRVMVYSVPDAASYAGSAVPAVMSVVLLKSSKRYLGLDEL